MDDRSKNKDLAKMNTGVKQFFNEVKAKVFMNLVKNGVKTIGNKGSHRSMYYICPANFYSHGSKTFLKNRRKGL